MIVVVIIILLIYSKKLQEPKEDDSEETPEKSTKAKKNQKEGNAEDLLGFRKIEQGVITLEDGRSLRAVIGVDAINYHSLSESEQEAVDGSMAGVLASLSFGIQPVSITSPVDLQDYIQRLNQGVQALPDTLREYANEHMRYLDEETRQEILIKKDFLVVGVDGIDDKQKAINELDRRCGLVISGLRRAGHIARVLDTQEVADVYYDIFHANRVINARLKDALGDESSSFAVQRETPVQPQFSQPKDKHQQPQETKNKGLVMLN